MEAPTWPLMAAAVIASGYAAVAGHVVRAWLAAGRHRRYADEWARPAPTYRALPAGCAAVAAILMIRLGPGGAVPAAAYVGLVPLYGALAAVDLDVHRLPDVLTLPAYPLVGALLAAAWLATPAGGGAARRAALAGLGTLVLFGALHLLSGRRLGLGDVKLSGPLGALLGWQSLDHVLLGVYAMFLCGGAAALWLLIRRRASRTTRLAFGPAMVAGAVLALAIGGAAPA